MNPGALKIMGKFTGIALSEIMWGRMNIRPFQVYNEEGNY